MLNGSVEKKAVREARPWCDGDDDDDQTEKSYHNCSIIAATVHFSMAGDEKGVNFSRHDASSMPRQEGKEKPVFPSSSYQILHHPNHHT